MGKAPDFDLMLTNAPGDASYPITATVFVVMNKSLSQARARDVQLLPLVAR